MWTIKSVITKRVSPSVQFTKHGSLIESRTFASVQFSVQLLPYSRKILRGIILGGLAVGVETTKLKPANIISYATHNNIVLHAV